jgi:hypothetical protein
MITEEEALRRTTLLNNTPSIYWTAEEAKSLDDFNQEKFCLVKQAFADRQTAVNYLEVRFGGIVYTPGQDPETIYPT